MTSSSPQFPLFSELPTELRLQIWALAIPHRKLPITCTKGILRPSAHRYAQSFETTSSPPALLLANHESRSVALLSYAPYFQTSSHPHGIFASFSHDIILLPENTLSYLGARELACIERLVLEVVDHAYFGHYNLEFLRKMGRLRWLELRVKEGVRFSWYVREGRRDILKDLRAEVVEWPEWRLPDVIRLVTVETGTGTVNGPAWVVRGRERVLELDRVGDGVLEIDQEVSEDGERGG